MLGGGSRRAAGRRAAARRAAGGGAAERRSPATAAIVPGATAFAQAAAPRGPQLAVRWTRFGATDPAGCAERRPTRRRRRAAPSSPSGVRRGRRGVQARLRSRNATDATTWPDAASATPARITRGSALHGRPTPSRRRRARSPRPFGPHRAVHRCPGARRTGDRPPHASSVSRSWDAVPRVLERSIGRDGDRHSASFALSGRHGVEIAVPAPGRAIRRRGISGRVLRVSAGEVVHWLGIRVTNPARTWCDLAMVLSVPELVAAGDWLLRRGLATAGSSATAARARPDRRGVGRIRVALPMLDPRSESPKESELRALIVTGRAARPSAQRRDPRARRTNRRAGRPALRRVRRDPRVPRRSPSHRSSGNGGAIAPVRRTSSHWATT